MANQTRPSDFPALLSDEEIESGRKPRPDSGPPVFDPWPPLETLLTLSHRHADEFGFRAPGDHDWRNVPMRGR